MTEQELDISLKTGENYNTQYRSFMQKIMSDKLFSQKIWRIIIHDGYDGYIIYRFYKNDKGEINVTRELTYVTKRLMIEFEKEVSKMDDYRLQEWWQSQSEYLRPGFNRQVAINEYVSKNIEKKLQTFSLDIFMEIFRHDVIKPGSVSYGQAF